MTGKIQIRLAVLAALAALTAVLVPSGLAFGDHTTHPSFSNLPNEGVLRLQLNGTNQWVYQEWDDVDHDYSGTETTQSISVHKKCQITNPVGTLAGLSSPLPVGLVTGDVGGKTGNISGTACGEFDASEDPLTIALGSSLADKEIDYAEIDIEGKHNVAVSIQAYLGESAVPMIESVAFDCTSPSISDCGPDSADGDNFRVIVGVQGQPGATGADVVASGVFDRLEISVTSASGEFSLNGGADGTAPGQLGSFLGATDSLFHITDIETIQCDVPADLTGAGVVGLFLKVNCDGFVRAIFTTDPAPDPDVNEVSLVNIAEDITGDPYQLEKWVFDEVPTHSQTGNWPADSDDADEFIDSGYLPVADTRLWYNDGNGDLVTPFCLIDPRIVVGGVPTFALDDGLDTLTIVPSGHTTCLIVDQRTVVNGLIQGQFILFSVGDASRGFR